MGPRRGGAAAAATTASDVRSTGACRRWRRHRACAPRAWRVAATLAALLVAVALPPLRAAPAAALFLPGLEPVDYTDGEAIPVFAHKLASTRVQMPYDYESLPYCPVDAADAAAAKRGRRRLSLGQLLMGERTRLTPYPLRLRRDVACAALCSTLVTADDAAVLGRRVRDGYRARLSMDDLPLIMRARTSTRAPYLRGHPLGEPAAGGGGGPPAAAHDGPPFRLYNHLSFVVYYHDASAPPPSSAAAAVEPGGSAPAGAPPRYRVVGFEVAPVSVDHAWAPAAAGAPWRLTTCPVNASTAAPLLLTPGSGAAVNVTYTYDVTWRASEVAWATRWDALTPVSTGRETVQWFAVANSALLSCTLTAVVAVIILRTLRRDVARYAALEALVDGDDGADEFGAAEDYGGWKLLRGDVFRAPAHAARLAALGGCGSQLAVMAAATVLVGILGFLSPSRRGGLLSMLITLWVLSSAAAGYVSARLHKALGGSGRSWLPTALGVALGLPAFTFSVLLFLNGVLWASGSVGATPFAALLALVALWFGATTPLTLAGARLGHRVKAYDFPVRTNQIPRPVPLQPAYLRAPWCHLAVGAVPFACVMIELRYTLDSLWRGDLYGGFFFVTLCFFLLTVVSAECAVVLVYAKLVHEDHRVVWDAFLAPATSGLYVLAYSVAWMVRSPDLGGASVVSDFLFVVYNLLVAVCFGLLTGAVGLVSVLWFMRRIFGAVRSD